MNQGKANEIGQPANETSHPNPSQNPITQESSSIPDTLISRPPKMRKKNKRRSVVWDHFIKLESGDENPIKEGEDDCDDFEILQWWQLNSSGFLLLSEMVHDVLAIPMSYVVSESAFSTCGRVLDEFRSSLTPKIIESFMCSQDWLQHFMEIVIEKEEQIEEVVNLEQEMANLGINVTSDFENE